MNGSKMLVPANKTSPIQPKSSSLFLLTSPGHNSIICHSPINKISSSSYCHCLEVLPRLDTTKCSLLFRYDLTLDEERDLALKRLKAVCDAGYISVLDFHRNPLKVFAAHELAVIDPAMGTKMTVQFNLFGGTVLKLGTDRHHDVLLKGIDDLSEVGCFALTELGYGNNAVEMETTATYDKVCPLTQLLLFSFREKSMTPGKELSLQFLPNTPLSQSRTLEGLF